MVVDLTPLYLSYKGEWVALKDDEISVISHGNNVRKVLESAVNKGFENPILFKVPTSTISYIG